MAEFPLRRSLMLRAEEEVRLAIARVSYLGSAGCQPAASGSLPDASLRNAQSKIN
jgi:hypothetical protein